MKILISPALQMKMDSDILPSQTSPVFINHAKEILHALKSLDYPAFKKVLKASEKLTSEAYDAYQAMDVLDLLEATTPALIAYQGIQYKTMGAMVFTHDQYAYLQDHLRILSGFYGLLRPFDGIAWHRLEMQARLQVGGAGNLYDYWASSIADRLEGESRVFLNLASEEYAKVVRPHLSRDTHFVTVRFEEDLGDRRVEKGVYVKMARGEMVRFMAEMGIEEVEDIKPFDRLGYSYDPDASGPNLFVFSRPGESTKG